MEEETRAWGRSGVAQYVRVALVLLSVYLAVLSLSTIKSLRFIGAGVPATNTISVSGTGDVLATPNVAEFTVSITEVAKDVASAQSTATTKGNAITEYLKGAGIAEKDIQTTDYSISPQYDYQANGVVCMSGYCPPGKQVLSGYQVNETLDVKVRDTAKAGDIIAGVGGKGASSVSGLNFTIDDQTAFEAQARDKAIADAKTKAEALARSLGVSLVRIVGYSENGSSPVRYAMLASNSMAATPQAAPAPDISVGQNKITSNITITYEIE